MPKLLDAAAAGGVAHRGGEPARRWWFRFSPEQVTQAWYEKGLDPFVYGRLANTFSYDAVNDAQSGSRPAANGPNSWMDPGRTFTARIGGPTKSVGKEVWRVALAKRAKAAPDTRILVWFRALGGVRVPMYRSLMRCGRAEKEPLFMVGGDTPGDVSRVVWVLRGLPWHYSLFGMEKAPTCLLLAGWGSWAPACHGTADTLGVNHFRGHVHPVYVPAVRRCTQCALGVLSVRMRKGFVEWKGGGFGERSRHALPLNKIRRPFHSQQTPAHSARRTPKSTPVYKRTAGT